MGLSSKVLRAPLTHGQPRSTQDVCPGIMGQGHRKIVGNFYTAARSTCGVHTGPVTGNLLLCFVFMKPSLAESFMVGFSLSKFEFRSYLGTKWRTFLPLQLPGKQTCGQRACSLWSLRLLRCQRLQQTQCLKRQKHHEMDIVAKGLSAPLMCS